jgi:2-dehydropantoate 2-reductase
MSTDLAVIGPGAVGAFFAAHAAAHGTDVVSAARRPFTEYVVESERHPVRCTARVVTDPASVREPVPFVLVAVKSHHTPDVLGWLDRLCGPSTVVVAAQNGLEARERLEPYVNGAEVVQSVVYCTTELMEPGRTRHYGAGWLWVPETPSMRRFAALFPSEGAEIRPTDRYVTELWRKLGFNITTNGITALTRRRLSVFAREDIATLGARLLAETWTVARAAGADLDPASGADQIPMMATLPGDPGTSTYYDRMAGRPTEHDAIYGSVVRAGRRLGVPTPLVETVWALLAAGDDAPA